MEYIEDKTVDMTRSLKVYVNHQPILTWTTLLIFSFIGIVAAYWIFFLWAFIIALKKWRKEYGLFTIPKIGTFALLGPIVIPLMIFTGGDIVEGIDN